MENDLFISYSREDADIVNQFVGLLTGAGYNVWIDREGIHPSDRMEKRVMQAIINSSVVLFFSSARSNSSNAISEVHYALNKGKTIIPIILDDDYKDRIANDLVDVDYIVFQSVASTMKKIISFLSDYIGKAPSLIASNPDLEDKPSEELFDLGQSCYDNRNYEQAVEYYESAAMKGHSEAQYSLGCCYNYGEGVTKDLSEAARWYRKAAEQGHLEAQYELGHCYEFGHGVCQSYEEAAKWYRMSAEQGHIDAQYMCGYFYEQGQGVTKDRKIAFTWYRKAADNGNAEAQYKLGLYYESGEVVSKDMDEAIKLYRLAAENGSFSAIEKLTELGVQ